MRLGVTIAIFALAGCGAARTPPSSPLELPTIPAIARDFALGPACVDDPTLGVLRALEPPELPTAAHPTDSSPGNEDARESADEEVAGEAEAPYENGGIDDGEPETPDDERSDAPATTDARLSWSEDELKKRVRTELPALGSLSLGSPAAGGLVNAVQMPSAPHWNVVDGSANWATSETVAFLTRALEKVYETHPDAPPIQIGHLSARQGGPLSPHRSHQSGRDVDVGYFYLHGESVWYKRATATNFDAARSWTLVRALLTEAQVEYVFVNHSVQRLLKEHALRIGEDPTWLDRIFQFDSTEPSPIIRHVHGHDTHLHVRFFNPVAEKLGRRALPFLPDRRVVEKRVTERLVPYRIRKGETLAVLARKFGTTVVAIQQANRLRNLKVVAGRTYLIPQSVAAAPHGPKKPKRPKKAEKTRTKPSTAPKRSSRRP